MSSSSTSAPTSVSDRWAINENVVSRRAAIGAGISAAVCGLGVAEMVAGLSQEGRSPLLLVGDRAIDLVPPFVKDIAIELFGTNDKIALLVGMAVVLAAFAAAVGVIALRRSFRLAVAGVGLFAVVGIAAAATARTGSFAPLALPTVGGATVIVFLLAWFRQVSAPRFHDDRSGANTSIAALTPNDRRRFMAQVGGVAAAGVAAGVTGRRLEARFDVTSERADLVLPTATEILDAIPASVQAEGAAPFITSNAEFYRIDTALTVPQLSTETWKLRVHGDVEQEIELDLETLAARGLIERDITLTCVSNTIGGELMGTARWTGIRLDDLIAEAGPLAGADQIVGRSVDGYTCGFPLAALDGRDALVAISMNGEPLPLEHGFPARLIVPGLYGYVSATKWLTEIELTSFDAFDHYWVPRGYAVEAPIKLQSRIDAPRGLDRIAPGPFAIGGVAWAQTIGIDAVELSIDEGPWMPAQLADELNDVTWRQWTFPWEATPGRHSITVRATDRNGIVQTADRAEPLPNGASGHHTVVVLVDEV